MASSDKLLTEEYNAFKALTDGLGQAASGATAMAKCRPDHSLQWEKVAESISVTREICFKLAEERVRQ